jgi:hypothetical protein
MEEGLCHRISLVPVVGLSKNSILGGLGLAHGLRLADAAPAQTPAPFAGTAAPARIASLDLLDFANTILVASETAGNS